MDYKIKILIALSIFILGISLGRCSHEPSDPIIKYIKGDTITDSIPYPEPYEVVKTNTVVLPGKIDTVFIDGDTVFVNTGEIDTAAILADYILKRNYSRVLLDDDTLGYLSVGGSVQYNKLISLHYKFNPITKQIETVREPLFTPFITGTYSTLGYVGIGGGVYIKDFGVQLKYLNNLELSNQGWEFGVVKKF